jgi:hypothetical protein
MTTLGKDHEQVQMTETKDYAGKGLIVQDLTDV